MAKDSEQAREKTRGHGSKLTDSLGTSLAAEAEYTSADGMPALLARYGVNPWVLESWRKRIAGDEQLRAEFEEKKAALRSEWKPAAVQALNEIIEALRVQASKAKALPEFSPEAMHKLAGAGKIIGELLTVKEALSPDVQQLRPIRKDSAPAQDAGLGARATGGAGTAAREPAATEATGATGGPVH